ncbi:MAG: ABC transporter ATP-binding protein [Chloroflexi bacterium]|nr:ABC transporter ATP-binding protein [Chloroflexota bacterium]
MPVIVLRHVTKHFGAESKTSEFDNVLASGARGLIDRGTSDYMRHMRTQPEPPNRQHAIDDLSLTIHDGETLGILGPSGCGKTTLLKVIAGLVTPDNGEVLYDSVPISEIPPSERGIGMVFQNYALFPHLPARDNIGFFDIVRRHPERIPQRIRYIVDVMGIEVEHLLSRKPPTLSGGEQQRVAIARCIARDPKIFLFDEPLSNLDAKLRVETRLQIKRLLRHYQITSVYVTHDQIEASTMGDRIAIMNNGKFEQIGTYHALYTTPVNAFVAQFFGSPGMNLFAGRISGSTWASRHFSTGPIRPALNEGQAVWLGIRPEAIELVPDGIPARVEHAELLYSERRQLLHVHIGEHPCVVSAPLDIQARPNDMLQLYFPPEHLYLFDQKTGKRIG